MKKTTITHQDDDVIRINDTLVYDPYNPVNIVIHEDDVRAILVRYGLPPIIHNMQIYRRAFIHRSYTRRPMAENLKQNITLAPIAEGCVPLRTKSNERLEFLGDGILECVTKFYLYRRFPKENEGFMTKTKIAIVNNESIGKIAFEMGLHKWINISRNAEESKIRTNLKRLGCLFEAFLGAIFLDMNDLPIEDEDQWFSRLFVSGPGYHMAQAFIERVFATHINWTTLIETDDNYKNILQVRIQKEFKVTQHYIEINPPINAVGYRDLDRGYHMGVYLCIGQPIHSVNVQTVQSLADISIQMTDASAGASSTSTANNSLFGQLQIMLRENNGKLVVCMGDAHHKIKQKAEFMACKRAIELLDAPPLPLTAPPLPLTAPPLPLTAPPLPLTTPPLPLTAPPLPLTAPSMPSFLMATSTLPLVPSFLLAQSNSHPR